MEGLIIQALGIQRDLSNGISELSLSEHENVLLLQYKDLIRDQDKKLQNLQKKYNHLQKEISEFKTQIEELQQTNTQLVDQNTLLKAQLSAGTTQVTNIIHEIKAPPPPSPVESQPIFIHGNNDALLERIKKLEAENERLEKVEEELAEKTSDIESYQRDQDDLLQLLTFQDTKLNKFKERLRQLGALPHSDDSSSDVSDNEKDKENGPSLL